MIKSDNYIVTGVTIVDGTGADPAPDKWMHVKNDKIIKIGDMSNPAFASDADVVDYSGRYIIPGMVESHVHMAGGRGDIYYDTSILTEPDLLRGMRSVYEAQQLLKFGFTTVRDISMNCMYLKRVFNDNGFPGPKIVACGRGLARTGGHCDAPNLDLDYVKKHHFWAIIADGVEECRHAVRTQLREGADQIKFWACGGGNWPTDRFTDVHYTFEEMKTICDEAHMIKGTIVCAHAETEESIRMAIEAGADTIEHGEELTEELCDIMVEKGIILVPTLWLLANWYDIVPTGELAKPVVRPHPYLQRDVGIAFSVEEQKEYMKAVVDNYKLALRKGVKIALGSDTTYDEEDMFGVWGNESLWEYACMVEHGMTPAQAIVAATSVGAEACGMQNRIGRLAEGMEADFLVFDEDPTSDVSVIANHENLKEVVLNGKTVCENGNLIW